MIPPLDPQTKRFYNEMGYSDPQIRQAFDLSKNTGIDIMDALAMQGESNAPPPPTNDPAPKTSAPQEPSTVHQDSYRPVQSFAYKSSTSFMTPLARIKMNDYEMLYSRTNKHHSTTSKIELR